MFVAVCWSKWCISIVISSVPLVDHSVVKVWILALLYKLTDSFREIIILKHCLNLWYFPYLLLVVPFGCGSNFS